MFTTGLKKLAVSLAQISPEKYYELVHEKDPYMGSLAGAAAGAVTGGLKGAKGHKSKHALVGAGTGALAGALGGHVSGKLLKGYQARKVNRMAEELHLKSTPSRGGKRHKED